MRILLLMLLCLPSFVKAQTLFLPGSENTSKDDLLTHFVEYKKNYYFSGIRDRGINSEPIDSVSGFCIKTNANGNVLARFQLEQLFGSPYISVNAVHAKDDQIFLVGATADYYNIDDKIHFNRLFILHLDTNLNYISVDTFSYGINQTANIDRGWHTFFLEDRIVTAYGCSINYNSSTRYSYITMYDYSGNRIRHKEIDSVFISRPPAGKYNEISRASKYNDSSFVILMRHYFPIPGTGASFYHTSSYFMDTALNIIESIDSIEHQQYIPSTTGPMINYCNVLRGPHGSYYIGPVIAVDSGSRIGLSKMFNYKDSIRTQSVLPGYANGDFAESLPAFNRTVQMLKNKREIVLLGCSRFAYIRVAKYDTALNLLWHRTFSKSLSNFITVGIHELQNSNLMVLAMVYDQTNATTKENNHDFYAFILDSTGTPLRTFTVPTPAQSMVILYPNPTQSVIRFSLPANSPSATYRITDLEGKTVLWGTYRSRDEVPVAALPPATYCYQVRTTNGELHSGMFTKQ